MMRDSRRCFCKGVATKTKFTGELEVVKRIENRRLSLRCNTEFGHTVKIRSLWIPQIPNDEIEHQFTGHRRDFFWFGRKPIPSRQPHRRISGNRFSGFSVGFSRKQPNMTRNNGLFVSCGHSATRALYPPE